MSDMHGGLGSRSGRSVVAESDVGTERMKVEGRRSEGRKILLLLWSHSA